MKCSHCLSSYADVGCCLNTLMAFLRRNQSVSHCVLFCPRLGEYKNSYPNVQCVWKDSQCWAIFQLLRYHTRTHQFCKGEVWFSFITKDLSSWSLGCVAFVHSLRKWASSQWLRIQERGRGRLEPLSTHLTSFHKSWCHDSGASLHLGPLGGQLLSRLQ